MVRMNVSVNFESATREAKAIAKFLDFDNELWGPGEVLRVAMLARQ